MNYKEVANSLAAIVGKKNVLTSEEDLKLYSYDAASIWRHIPDVVVFPTETAHVEAICKLANENKIPVTPRGGATNLSGGSVPIKGGIVLVLTKMDKILSIDPENLSAKVEAGVLLMDFQTALEQKRLFFPPDPQSALGATIGGIIAENAGGPLCVKYGVTKQYVLGLKVVLPTGRLVVFGSKTVKNVAGYDLVSLITGSEGTLAIITEAILRLIPMPQKKRTIIALFDELPLAGEVVGRIFDAGIIPSKIELLDNWVINKINKLSDLDLPTDAAAMLMFEVDGNPDIVELSSQIVINTSKTMGASKIIIAKNDQEALKYWKTRSMGFSAVFGSAPTVIAEDITVPRSRMAEFITRVTDISKKAGVEVTVIGHAGDGNLHPTFMTDENDQAHFEKTQKVIDEVVELSHEFDGALSGEHGIGLEKKRFMRRIQDPIFIEIIKQIKKVFDPNGILNPGKIWEE